jgi:MazG family protein
MATLRAPGGCAWDRKQTLSSLRASLLEEAYEVLEAMESGEPQQHQEELGDLLLQVVMQAEICREAGGFDVGEVVAGLDAKLKRRHPHVFADAEAVDAAAAGQQWEAMKVQERRTSAAAGGRLSGVPRALPGLLRAYRVGEKAAAAGFDWQEVAACEAKFHEEWAEFTAARQQGQVAEMADEMGDVLMSLVSLCRHLNLEPEACIGQSVNKFMSRFAHMEQATGSDRLTALTPAAWESLWQAAKAAEAIDRRSAG